ncbi:hypothetical protein [Staphylococcus pseudintermedius]|uniref:hypothetical protein n=1 Tax=Staphylococcus pseudintermedius TaxID=283734 RepID=UPI001E4E7B5D|nr:hypothetical protein [Staphylococcus pseudintermedius]
MEKLKETGAKTVGIRFETLPEEKIKHYAGAKQQEEQTTEGALARGNQLEIIASDSGKGGVGKLTVAVDLAVV